MSRHPIKVSGEGYQIGLDVPHGSLLGEFSESFRSLAVAFGCRLFSVVHGNPGDSHFIATTSIKALSSDAYDQSG
jgi:hypothetical protein